LPPYKDFKIQQTKENNGFTKRVTRRSKTIKGYNTSVTQKLKIQKDGWEAKGNQPL
jgi:hypothetical protein